MAIRQEDPVSFFSSLHEDLLSFVALSSSKGNCFDLGIVLHRELHKEINRIHSWGQNENDWCFRSRLVIDLLELCRLDFYKLLLHVGLHVLSNGEQDSVGSETSEDDHFLQVILTLSLPFAWKLSIFGFGPCRKEPPLPLVGVEGQIVADQVESLR